MSEQRQDEVTPPPAPAARRIDGRGCAWTLCWCLVGLWALLMTAGILADMV